MTSRFQMAVFGHRSAVAGGYYHTSALKSDGASLVTIAHEELGVGGQEGDGARLQITATEPAKLPRAIDLVYPKLARVSDTGRWVI